MQRLTNFRRWSNEAKINSEFGMRNADLKRGLQSEESGSFFAQSSALSPQF
jgi:hypothetical protein